MRTSNSPNLFHNTIIVLRRTTFVGGIFLTAVVLSPALATAATIFESGMLGETGILFGDLVSGAVPATNVGNHVFAGVRFQLDQPVITSQIGGHFVERDKGSFFGAIVALDDGNDFPDTGDFSSSDFIGATLLDFPNPSREVFGDLSLSLDPGWYALVFGSELLEASGRGATLRNGDDIGDSTYILFQPGSGVGWVEFNAAVPRFIIRGQIVPEPSSVGLILLGSLFLVNCKSFHS